MKKITAINMNWSEYCEVVDKATRGKVALITDLRRGWDYGYQIGYEYNIKETNDMVGKFLKVNVVDVIIDISNDENCVVVICE